MPPRAGAARTAYPIDPIIVQLQKARTDKKMSISHLATVLGISKATIGAWERGSRQCSVYWLRRWAAALGLTLTLTPINSQGQTT